MPRKTPAPDGWITINRVSIDYGARGNRRLVLGLCRHAGIPVRRLAGALCIRRADLRDLLAWLEIWRHRPKL